MLVTLDSQSFPFNASEDDDQLKVHSKLATTLWRTLLAQCLPTPSASSSIEPSAPPPAPQQPVLGDQRAAATEARKLAEELERSRLRAVCADIAGPGAQGGNFSTEFVTARASEQFLGHAQLRAAFASLVCASLGVSPFDEDGVTTTPPAKIFSKIPHDAPNLDKWTALLQEVDNLEEASSLLYKGWRTMHRSYNTSWRNMVQMAWQDQEDAAEHRINKDHPLLKTFEEKLALSISKLKDNIPGSICPAAAAQGNRNGGNAATPKREEADTPKGRDRDRAGRAAPRPPKKQYERKKYESKPYDRDNDNYASRKINYDRDQDRGGRNNGGGDRDRDYDRAPDRRGRGGGYYRGRGGGRH